MKIALVCPYDFSRPGGVKSHIVSLGKYLTISGHQVSIIAPNINAEKVTEKNVHFFGSNRSLNLGGTKIDINIALGSEKRVLRKFLKEEKFDVIHYHTIWNPLLPFQIRSLSKARHVATFHDTPSNSFIGRWIMPLVARWVFTLLDEIISVSETQAAYISRFSKRDIHIIPNGIDLDEIARIVSNYSARSDDYIQFLFLGRLEPRKGAMHALQAFRRTKERYPKTKLVIAGDGDGRKQIEDYILNHNLEDVELLGFVSEEKKYLLLKESDLYLAPALYGESFGIVLLESMAAGTAMAGYANEGYKNVLTEELLMGFAEPYDSTTLVDKISTLMSPEVRKHLVKRGLSEVKKYDWSILSQQIITTYK